MAEKSDSEGVRAISGSVKGSAAENLYSAGNTGSFFTLKQLCEVLSISYATGYNWVKAGRLKPHHRDEGMPLFTAEYAEFIRKGIESESSRALKRRRNKKYISGNGLYHSYVSEDCKAAAEVRKLLTLLEEENTELTEKTLRLFLADCALKLWANRTRKSLPGGKSLLLRFLQNEISIGEHEPLIRALIADNSEAVLFCQEHASLFEMRYRYEPREDILGLIYISCKNIGNRKATGAYYTSNRVVRQLIGHLDIKKTDKILDPCCGTGNFLLQLPGFLGIRNIYGNDADEVSVRLTRLNLALRFPKATTAEICEHVKMSDYLLSTQSQGFHHIIGNPPWGYEFTDEKSGRLRRKYQSAVGKNIESYDVFIEQALKHLVSGGTLAFVLPEAVLNVKAHRPIRQYIMNDSAFVSLDYLGNAFDGVLCPCIILQLKHMGRKMPVKGMTVNSGGSEYTIHTDREPSADCFNFTMRDEEYGVLRKMTGREDVSYLLNHADFAMGIVTGNNREYISDVKTEGSERILAGADIRRYHVHPAERYIVFTPDKFHQTAPVERYRAREKLLYRFICRQLVFAYDDRQRLSLNSCNIVIPRIEGLQVKYILAVLNSRPAQFLFRKQFHSVKVLKSHVESIPIPNASETCQNEMISIVDQLMDAGSPEEAKRLYDVLDEKVAALFELNPQEMEIVRASVEGEDMFLDVNEVLHL